MLDQVTCAWRNWKQHSTGALIVVTHDRRFISRWRGTVLDLKETSLANH